MSIDSNIENDEEALKAFLLDIDCLSPLNEWTSKFNLFDVLKISRTQIRHSNMLAWLLSPNENHGLGDSVLRGLLQQIVLNEQVRGLNVFQTLLMDLHTFTIQREWQNIDIVISSEKQHFVLCIENKIDSGEHDNQLVRYRHTIERTFPSYRHVFLYLSPQGIKASDNQYWVSMSYSSLLTIIDKTIKQTELLPDVSLIISNYMDIIRRDIVGDERLARICEQIYAKHGRALDLIFQHRPDKAALISQTIFRWCKEKEANSLITVYDEKCSKTYNRFSTPYMSSILPDSDAPDSGWNTKNHYYYEIVNRNGTKLHIQFVVSAKNLPDNLKTLCNTINQCFPGKKLKDDWQWRTFFTSKSINLDDDTPDDKICQLLDKRLEEVFQFEKRLKEKLIGTPYDIQ